MDPTIEYLWAAGYDLPPETTPKPASPQPKRRGKKAARAKRQKVSK
jgi:hypothetical protein